jgi:hypothetical protein
MAVLLYTLGLRLAQRAVFLVALRRTDVASALVRSRDGVTTVGRSRLCDMDGVPYKLNMTFIGIPG